MSGISFDDLIPQSSGSNVLSFDDLIPSAPAEQPAAEPVDATGQDAMADLAPAPTPAPELAPAAPAMAPTALAQPQPFQQEKDYLGQSTEAAPPIFGSPPPKIGDIEFKPGEALAGALQADKSKAPETFASLGEKLFSGLQATTRAQVGGGMQAAGDYDASADPQVLGMMGYSPDTIAGIQAGKIDLKGNTGPLAQKGQQIYAAAAKDIEAAQPNLAGAPKFVFDVADTMVKMAPMIAITMASKNPEIGLAAGMGPQVYSQQYGSARAEGQTPEEARAEAAFYTISETGTELPFLENLVKISHASGFTELLKSMGFEAAGEMVNQAVEQTYEAAKQAHKEGISFKDAWEKQGGWGAVGYAGGLGAAAGGGFHVAGHLAEKAFEPSPEKEIFNEVNDQNFTPEGTMRQVVRSLDARRFPSAPLTPEDQASALPDDLIGEGKAIFGQVLGNEGPPAQGAPGQAVPAGGVPAQPELGQPTAMEGPSNDSQGAGGLPGGSGVNGPIVRDIPGQEASSGPNGPNGDVQVPQGQSQSGSAGVRSQEAQPVTQGVEAPAESKVSAAPVMRRDGTAFKTEGEARLASTSRGDLKGKGYQAVQVEGGWGLALPDTQSPGETARAASTPAPAAVSSSPAAGEISEPSTHVPHADEGPGTAKSPVVINTAADMEQIRQRIHSAPSDGQKDAGNYALGHGVWHGIPLAFETAKGGVRRSKADARVPWMVPNHPTDYGYAKTEAIGKDGDKIDVHMGPNPESKTVFAIDQYDTGTQAFDEHKFMLGFNTQQEAEAAYDAAFTDSKGPQRRLHVQPMSDEQFKQWLENGKTKMPIEGQKLAPPQAETPNGALAKQPREPSRPTGPQSLLPWISRYSSEPGKRGMYDDGGEIRARDALNHFVPGAGKPFTLNKQAGNHPDKVREGAIEAGYLPEGATVSDLYAAIDHELGGNKQFPMGETDQSKAAAERDADRNRAQMEQLADEYGVDPNGKTDAELQELLEAVKAENDAADAFDASDVAAIEAELSGGDNANHEQQAVPFEGSARGEEVPGSRTPRHESGGGQVAPAEGAPGGAQIGEGGPEHAQRRGQASGEVDQAEGFDPAQHTLLVADTPAQIRRQDLPRLFEEAPHDADAWHELRAYLIEKRPDLGADILNAVDEAGGYPKDEAAEAASKRSLDELGARMREKGAAIKRALEDGTKVVLRTQTHATEYSQADDVRVGNAEVRFRRGNQWNAATEAQLDDMVAQAESARGPRQSSVSDERLAEINKTLPPGYEFRDNGVLGAIYKDGNYIGDISKTEDALTREAAMRRRDDPKGTMVPARPQKKTEVGAEDRSAKIAQEHRARADQLEARAAATEANIAKAKAGDLTVSLDKTEHDQTVADAERLVAKDRADAKRERERAGEVEKFQTSAEGVAWRKDMMALSKRAASFDPSLAARLEESAHRAPLGATTIDSQQRMVDAAERAHKARSGELPPIPYERDWTWDELFNPSQRAALEKTGYRDRIEKALDEIGKTIAQNGVKRREINSSTQTTATAALAQQFSYLTGDAVRFANEKARHDTGHKNASDQALLERRTDLDEALARAAGSREESKAAPATEKVNTVEGKRDQFVMPGTEQSAKQAAASRESEGKGKLKPKVHQEAADTGLFAAPNTQSELFGETKQKAKDIGDGWTEEKTASGVTYRNAEGWTYALEVEHGDEGLYEVTNPDGEKVADDQGQFSKKFGEPVYDYSYSYGKANPVDTKPAAPAEEQPVYPPATATAAEGRPQTEVSGPPSPKVGARWRAELWRSFIGGRKTVDINFRGRVKRGVDVRRSLSISGKSNKITFQPENFSRPIEISEKDLDKFAARNGMQSLEDMMRAIPAWQKTDFSYINTDDPDWKKVNNARRAWNALDDQERAQQGPARYDEIARATPDRLAPKAATYGTANKVFTAERKDAALAKLREKLKTQISAGIDPEILAAGAEVAGYHIEAGARKFLDFARAVADELGTSVQSLRQYLRAWYNGARDMLEDSGVDVSDMDTPDQVREALKNLTEAKDVPSAGVGLEPGGEGGPAANGVREAPVSAEPSGIEHGSRAGERQAEEGRSDGPIGSELLPPAGAAPVGEGGDRERGGAEPRARAGAPERGGRGGSSDVGVAGPPVERTPAAAVERAATARTDLAAKRKAQRQATLKKVVKADAENIAATLPFLTDPQRDDVHRAEQRFAKPEGHGFLFTNGTGTGKTYTGGGLVARGIRSGAKNIIVIVPSQDIAADWLGALENLAVDARSLADTQDKGGGVVVTTYANFGQNRHLADIKWDLAVADESHNLAQSSDSEETAALSAFRAHTNHPDGLRTRARMALRDDYDVVEAITRETSAAKRAMTPEERAKWDAYQRKEDALVEQYKKEPRAKAVFLSATPFAYVPNIDYAQGYLFDWGPEPSSRGGYNQPDARSAFYIQHFGYRMRTGKLTKPDAAVNSEVMERQFHEWLKTNQKSLWGRQLEVDADYDRKFVLVNNAIGNDIDKVLKFLWEADDHRFAPIESIVRDRFDYLARMRLLEAIKAADAIDLIKEHHALGRKVLVFHDFNQGGGINPFTIDDAEHRTYQDRDGKPLPLGPLYREFLARNPEIERMDFAHLPAPILALKAAFPKALLYNGTVPVKQRRQAKADFNDDDKPDANLIVVQAEAGKAGISLHDTTGKHQRVLINLGMPTRPVTAIQQEGRIRRLGSVSDALFRYLNTGTNWERWTFAGAIAQRAGTAENLALGDQARALRQSFIDAFNATDVYPATKDEGTGGKEADRASNNQISPYDRAKSFYYAQQKLSGRRDQRAGIDYFPTAEPLGFKMVEWANLKLGEKSLEPSAGHGAIARFLPEDTNRTIIEPSAELASRAAVAAPGAKMIVDRFENLHVNNKYDGIVMNPPYGVGGKTAIEHVALAVQHLRNGGRVVALIPAGGTATKRFEDFMDSDAAKNVYVAARIQIPPVAFERAGTSVRTEAVVLEKQTNPDDAPQQVSRDLSNAETINEFFDRLENVGVPDRTAPTTPDVDVPEIDASGQVAVAGIKFDVRYQGGSYHVKPLDRLGTDTFRAAARAAEKAGGAYARGSGLFTFGSREQRDSFFTELAKPTPAAAAEPGAAAPGVHFTTGETKHSKHGYQLYVASIADRVERDVYDKVNDIAKKHGGQYSSFRGSGAIPGFQFRTAEARSAFLQEMAGEQPARFSLRRGQDDVTATPEFKRWFGDSKVVDANGKPLVVYHGTPNEFDAFDGFSPDQWVGPGWNDTAETHLIYFSDHRPTAKTYGRRVVPVYLSLRNPLELDAGGQIWANFGIGSYVSEALRNGHDGMIVRNVKDAAYGNAKGPLATTYVAFKPEQVKSTDNRGTFDPNDARIQYSVRKPTTDKVTVYDQNDQPVQADQYVAPGAERSDEQAKAAERAKNKAELELRAKQSKMRTSAPQREGGGLFGPEKGEQGKLFALRRDNDALFTVTPDAEKRGAEAVRNALDSGLPKTVVHLGTAPPVLRTAGLPNRLITTDPKTLRKAMDVAHNDHNVTRETLETLPALLADPVVVFRTASSDADKSGRFIVMLRARDASGRPVVVTIDPSGERNKLNFIPSIYGKNDVERWMLEQARSGRLLYESKENGPGDVSPHPFPGPIPGWNVAVRAAGRNVGSELDVIKRFGQMPEPEAKSRLGQGTAGQAPGIGSAEASHIKSTLEQRLKQVDPSGRLFFRLVPKIEAMIDGRLSVPDGQYLRRLIEVALTSEAVDAQGNKGPGAAWTFNHELIHGLRDLGVFKDDEWNALKKAALAGEAAMNEVRKRYAGQNLSDESLIEERIADMFADWAAGKTPAKGFIRNAFERLRAYLKALGASFREAGYRSVDDIFEGVDRGYVGEREGASDTTSVSPRFAEAWHGTPHDFDQFDTSKIGTGEGRQAFGYGLYFAGNKAVGEFYKHKLASSPDIYFKGKKVEPGTWLSAHLANIESFTSAGRMSLKQALDDADESLWQHLGARERAAAAATDPQMKGAAEQDVVDIKDAREQLRSTKEGDIEFRRGRLFHVELAPKDNEWLDWDKPLDQQSDKVTAALDKIPQEVWDAIDEALDSRGMNPMSDGKETYTGGELYQALTHHEVNEALPAEVEGSSWYDGKTSAKQHTSMYLKSIGIPGIRYLDQGSRGKAEGSSNYVVFDAKDVSVKSKLSLRRGTTEQERAINKAIAPRSSRTIGQRIAEAYDHLRTNLADEFTWAVADEFHGLRKMGKALMPKAADRELGSYVGARLARHAAGQIEAFLRWGAPRWNDENAVLEHDGSGGLYAIVEPIYRDGLERLFDGYAYARRVRTQKLIEQEREQNLTEAEVDDLLNLTNDHPEFAEIFDKIQAFKKKVLDAVEGMGLINADQRAVWEKADHVPFYRATEEGSPGPNKKGGLANQSPNVRRLTGKGVTYAVIKDATGEVVSRFETANEAKAERQRLGATEHSVEAAGEPIVGVIENIARNITHLLDAAMKNHAATVAMDEALELGWAEKEPMAVGRALVPLGVMASSLERNGIIVGDGADGIDAVMAIMPPVKPGNGVIAIRREGKTEYYKVADRLVYRALAGLYRTQMSAFVKPLAKIKNLLTRSVTAMPGFMVRNFVRDSAASWLISEERGLNFYGEMFKSMKALAHRIDDPKVQAMMAAGGDTGWYQNAPEDVVKQLRKLERAGQATMLRYANPKELFHAYEKLGRASELANRAVTFDSEMKRSGNARAAAFSAADLLDFQLKGGSDFIQFMTAIVPFLNARIQGLYKLGRAGLSTNAPERKMFLAKGAMMLAFSLALAALNAGDDDDNGYNDLPEWVKDGSWVINNHRIFGKAIADKVGLPRFFLIPKPFELGVVFGTMPERIVQLVAGNDRAQDTWKSVYTALLSTFEFDPFGNPVTKEIMEQWANKDLFTGTPIVSDSLSRQPAEQQYNVSTSESTKWLGEKLGLSPLRIEHAIRGFTGTLGTYMLAASDAGARALGLSPPKPALRPDQMEIVRSFMADDPALGTKWMDRFYQLRSEAEGIYEAAMARARTGDLAGARDLARGHTDLLKIRAPLNTASIALADIRKSMNEVKRSLSLSPAEKRDRLDGLRAQENLLAKRVAKAGERVAGE